MLRFPGYKVLGPVLNAAWNTSSPESAPIRSVAFYVLYANPKLLLDAMGLVTLPMCRMTHALKRSTVVPVMFPVPPATIRLCCLAGR
jgi:hypothetical protein